MITKEEIEKRVNERSPEEYEFVDFEKFNGCFSDILIKHIFCGRILKFRLNNFVSLGRGCKFCYGREIDNKKLLEMTEKIVGNEYTWIDKYSGKSQTPIKIRHNVCGQMYNVRPADFLYNTHRCPHCSGSIPFSEKTLITRINEFSKDFTFVSFSKKDKPLSKSLILVKHNSCGKIFETSVGNFLYNNRGCKLCNLENLRKKFGNKMNRNYQSVGKLACIDFLNDANVSYELEKTFDWLKYKRKMYIDIFLPGYNVAIEYDGKQHFLSENSSSIFAKNSILQKERDKEKTRLLEEHGISLLRISKTDQNEIKKELREFLERSTTIDPKITG